jgi:hypothetical protein
MSAQPSRRSESIRPARSRSEPVRRRARLGSEDDRAVRIERRRRLTHLRRRRRDLLEDVVGAIVLMILALIVTPGLGVLALIEVPLALGLIATVLAERRWRKRRLAAGRTARRAPRG